MSLKTSEAASGAVCASQTLNCINSINQEREARTVLSTLGSVLSRKGLRERERERIAVTNELIQGDELLCRPMRCQNQLKESIV